ncbi:unnamed protein product [Jaminaea pallidilutea]
MTIAFFCLSALDLLGALHSKTSDEERQSYRDWIYRMQCPGGGFSGSPSLGTPSSSSCQGEHGHLAMTYTALANLAILRDDFTCLDRRALRNLLKTCQRRDGSFSSTPGALEYDPRFTYCAFAVCSMLGDWTAIDVESALRYLDCCQTYDGVWAQAPHQESHGGSTYCALAAYCLAGQLKSDRPRFTVRQKRRMQAWLLARQSSATYGGGGERSPSTANASRSDQRHSDEEEDDELGLDGAFNGRINKTGDSCYSFWCGASLAILDSYHLIDAKANAIHLLALQTPVGGIPKTAADHPDAMHSYLSLAALALLAHVREGGGRTGSSDSEEDGWRQRCGIQTGISRALDPCLNVGVGTVKWISEHLHLNDDQ